MIASAAVLVDDVAEALGGQGVEVQVTDGITAVREVTAEAGVAVEEGEVLVEGEVAVVEDAVIVEGKGASAEEDLVSAEGEARAEEDAAVVEGEVTVEEDDEVGATLAIEVTVAVDAAQVGAELEALSPSGEKQAGQRVWVET